MSTLIAGQNPTGLQAVAIFCAGQQGQNLVEYALVAMLIALLALTTIATMAGAVFKMFNSVANDLTTSS